jgi:hypothetical protein
MKVKCYSVNSQGFVKILSIKDLTASKIWFYCGIGLDQSSLLYGRSLAEIVVVALADQQTAYSSA